MTHARDSVDRPEGLSLANLFTQYLQQQATAQAEGLGYAEPTDEVVPYEAAPVQPVDPKLAWTDAAAAAAYLSASPVPALAVPPEWPVLVAAQEPAVAVAFCLGNYPQLVRNLHVLLNGDPVALRVAPTRPGTATQALLEWARRTRTAPQSLLAAGVLRLVGDFDKAETVLEEAEVPSQWKALRDNEKAGLIWQRGRADEALSLWQAQEPRPPILFNRGMALLFLGRFAEARTSLTEAVGQLPETSAWHHLGQLYLALAAGKR
jgi:tetratricopeptide (TPR) repeat protein